MKIRRHGVKLMTLVVVVSMPLLGLSAAASAKAAVGSAKWCAAHPKLAKTTPACSTSTGKGTGGDPPTITVQIDPTPLVETYESDIVATIQVETSASFADDAVTVSSSQLTATCDVGTYFFTQSGISGADSATVYLDDDGNATLAVVGGDCAPGSDVVEADLAVAPYYTALGTLEAEPPVVTTAGVYGYPTTSGTVTTGEVETGDTPLSGESDVYAIFYVETDPVYAEQQVELSAPELESRCGEGWTLLSFTGTPVTSTSGTVGPPETATLDDDGNAVFGFYGASCAAGPSDVIADVLAGTHTTYTTVFNIVAPAPTI
jgi:hypothetical protein